MGLCRERSATDMTGHKENVNAGSCGCSDLPSAFNCFQRAQPVERLAGIMALALVDQGEGPHFLELVERAPTHISDFEAILLLGVVLLLLSIVFIDRLPDRANARVTQESVLSKHGLHRLRGWGLRLPA